MQEMKLKFTRKSMEALNIMENTNKSLYLTGEAGTGKSTIVNYFISKTKKRYILLGTTGVASINIGGRTIHSFFGLSPTKKRSMKKETIEIIKHTDIFLIDEASMMRADLFDTIDRKMKTAMDNDEFLGGKQFVFIGDLFQLPPVPERDEDRKEKYDERYKGLFFFHGNSYMKDKITTIQLSKVYRQDDIKFINMLNRVRRGESTQDILDFFNKRVVKEDEISPKSILIGTTNSIVEQKNNKELEKLPGDKALSKAIIKGEYPEDQYPTDIYLNIKEGARIMFTLNSDEFANGTLGTIQEIKLNSSGFPKEVTVLLDSGYEISVIKYTWTHSEGEDEFGNPVIEGTFTQFPFKLAFAITIHKSQGKSFDNVVIDLGWGAFADGQTYVALSRCRSYEGLQLIKPIKKRDIKVSQEVLKFLNG